MTPTISHSEVSRARTVLFKNIAQRDGVSIGICQQVDIRVSKQKLAERSLSTDGVVDKNVGVILGLKGRVSKSLYASYSMCPCEFARAGSVILIAVGLLGAIGFLGPTASENVLDGKWWLGWTEIVSYLIVASLLFFASRAPTGIERPVVLCVGWLFVLLAATSLFTNTLLTVHFERPIETFFYLILGVWAIFAGFCKDPDEETPEEA